MVTAIWLKRMKSRERNPAQGHPIEMNTNQAYGHHVSSANVGGRMVDEGYENDGDSMNGGEDGLNEPEYEVIT